MKIPAMTVHQLTLTFDFRGGTEEELDAFTQDLEKLLMDHQEIVTIVAAATKLEPTEQADARRRATEPQPPRWHWPSLGGGPGR